MIMISDMAMTANVTERSTPAWMTADNYNALLNQDKQRTSLKERFQNLLKR